MIDQPPPANDLATKATSIISDIQSISSNVAAASKLVTDISWWTAIKGLCAALPQILSLIKSFMAWINAISGNNPQAFIAGLGQSFAALAAAKTQEERQNAAQNLANHISKLPS